MNKLALLFMVACVALAPLMPATTLVESSPDECPPLFPRVQRQD